MAGKGAGELQDTPEAFSACPYTGEDIPVTELICPRARPAPKEPNLRLSFAFFLSHFFVALRHSESRSRAAHVLPGIWKCLRGASLS